MRLEIDSFLESELNEIRSKNYGISGKGHTGTVRFLVNYYKNREPIAELLNTCIGGLDIKIRKAFVDGLREILSEYLKGR